MNVKETWQETGIQNNFDSGLQDVQKKDGELFLQLVRHYILPQVEQAGQRLAAI